MRIREGSLFPFPEKMGDSKFLIQAYFNGRILGDAAYIRALKPQRGFAPPTILDHGTGARPLGPIIGSRSRARHVMAALNEVLDSPVHFYLLM